MDEMQKAKCGMILYSVWFCAGLATLFIDIIPIIAIGAIIFCPIYAIKSLKKYMELRKLQLESLRPLDYAEPAEYFQL